MLAALVAAAGIASSFAGNAVYVVAPGTEPALKLRLDTGGYDLVSAAAAQRAHLKAGSVHLQSGDRATYELPAPSALSLDALLEARPGALESTFVEPVDGTLSLGRFAAQPLTIDFPHRTVTVGESHPGGDRIALTVGAAAPPAPGLPSSMSAVLPVTIGGERVTMLLDTGADVAIDAPARDRFDDAAATRSLPLISRDLFDRLHARHRDWTVLDGAGRMAETKRPVTLLRVPDFIVGAHRGPPTWFAVREDPATYAFLTRAFKTSVQGDLGGEALRRWRVTIDVARETLVID
jgi:hypothetical protein